MCTKKFLKVFGLLLVVVLLAAALPLQAKAEGEPPQTLNVAEWTGPTNTGITGRETVLKVGDTYHMWYSSSNEKTLYHTYSDNPASFSAATSACTFTDGTPFEVGSVSVVKEGDYFYMIAYGADNQEFAIYKSSDGTEWTFGGVIFEGSVLPNLNKIDGAYLFLDGSTFRLYFQVKTPATSPQYYNIYLAEATETTLALIADGDSDVDFTLNSTNPVLNPGGIGTWDAEQVMHPWVVKDGSNYYMWYSGWGTGFNQQVGMAKSTNGVNWVKSPANPIFAPATGYAEPSVIKVGNTWQMWTMGTGGVINYLTATGPFEFQSIQAAIDAASAGDTINVAAGTYTESPTTTNKPLNFVGTPDAGGELPLIEGTLTIDSTGYTPADNISIDSLSFSAAGDYDSIVLKKVDGVTIRNSTFDGNDQFMTFDNGGRAVQMYPSPNNNVTIDNCSFEDGYYVTINGYVNNLTVNNSTFTNVKSGINVQGPAGNTVTIDNTDFSVIAKGATNDTYGVRFASGGTTASGGNLTITNSSFVVDKNDLVAQPGTYHSAIIIREGATGALSVKNSSILGEIVNLTLSNTLDASPNWWGNAAGPGASQISGAVDYRPWCADAECTTFASAALNMTPAAITTTGTCTGTQTVEVQVNDVVALTAYELEVTFNPNFIEVTGVVNGGFLSENGTSYGNYIDNVNGKLRFNWYQIGSGGDPGPKTGSGSLIKITFKSKGLAGESAFAITAANSILVNWPDAFAIPFAVTGGATVNFGSVVTNTSASPNKAYCDLALAVSEAAAGNTLRADADFTTTAKVIVDKALTFDTNLKTVSRTGAASAYDSVFEVNPGGDLTITGGGTLTSSNEAHNLGAAIRIVGGKVGDTVTPAKVTLLNATLSGSYASVNVRGNTDAPTFDTAYPAQFSMTGGKLTNGIVIYGNGSELNITGGTVNGWAPIMGNGTVNTTTNNGGTKITIGGDAVIDGDSVNDCLAIYHPQDGQLIINGGTIIGTNGIEMKAGNLTITGGTISATGPFVAVPDKTGSGTTDTGDAILIYNRDGYGIGKKMNVTISGSPTITSANGYALREFTHAGETSRLGVATISGGHFTGGTPGAVSFTTVSDANLELTGGDYSTDPKAYVYPPYFTYQSGNRWYIAIPPTISSTDIQGYYLTGEQREFHVTATNPSTGGSYAHVIFQFNVTADAGDLSLEYYEGSTWHALPLTCASGVCSGYYGPSTGFPMPNPYSATSLFRVTAAVPGSYPVEIKLLDLDTDPDAVLATYTNTAVVYDKPSVTSTDIQGYYLVGEARDFHVQVNNPATGGGFTSIYYNFEIANASLADIASLVCDGNTIVLQEVGTSLKGSTGPFPMPAGASWNTPCNVKFNTAKTYTFTVSMTDTTPDPDRILQTYSSTANVYTKPTLTSTDITGPYLAGVPKDFHMTVDNPATGGNFDNSIYYVFTIANAEPTDIASLSCNGIPVTLTDSGADLTGRVGYGSAGFPMPPSQQWVNTCNVQFAKVGSYGFTVDMVDNPGSPASDRLLVRFQATAVVNGNFAVTGTFSMQGNLNRGGIPVTLTWTGTGWTYAESDTTEDLLENNFQVTVTYGGGYLITTNQPRYLNIGNYDVEDQDVTKSVTVDGAKTLSSLWLRGGNAVWTDNVIDVNDASKVGTDWGSTDNPDGNVNFDSIVNIQDLALVGGNFGLTSATAYASWTP